MAQGLGSEAPSVVGRSAHSGGGSDAVSYAARLCALLSLLVVGVWVHQYLGGVGVAPEQGGASTDKIFNWHPVLMTLGFGVLMTEAVLAYKAPWVKSYSRQGKRQLPKLALCLLTTAVTVPCWPVAV